MYSPPAKIVRRDGTWGGFCERQLASDFVHLHVHSDYSLLDGSCQMEALLDRAKAEGMDAMALTDHGNLFGAVHFYKAAKERGIKPILGMEAYLATGSRFDKAKSEEPGRRKKSTFHATLLASSRRRDSRTSSSSRRPRTSTASTAAPASIATRCASGARTSSCLSGCLAGEVAQAILADEMEGAERVIREYKELFGAENYYLEIMNHGMPEEDQVRDRPGRARARDRDAARRDQRHPLPRRGRLGGPGRRALHRHRRARARGEPVPDEHEAALVQEHAPDARPLRGVSRGGRRDAHDRGPLRGRDHARQPVPARRFPPEAGETPDATFRRLCEEGVARLYPAVTPEIRARLEYEIGVIVQTRFVAYFLIVWDFIRCAREHGIPVGPGRGSAAGSLVAYALGITQRRPARATTCCSSAS